MIDKAEKVELAHKLRYCANVLSAVIPIEGWPEGMTREKRREMADIFEQIAEELAKVD